MLRQYTYIYLFFRFPLVHTLGWDKRGTFIIFLYSANLSFIPEGTLTFYCTLHIFFCLGHSLLSHSYIEGEPPPPRSTPWGAYRPIISHTRWNPYYHWAYLMQLSLSHSLLIDRSTVVGHVPTDHMCSFMYTSHIDMTVHNQAFLRVG